MTRLLCFKESLKAVFLAALLPLTVACQSPVKKQLLDREQKVNTFQNPNAEATTKPEKRVSSGNLTDSVHRTDTGTFKPN